MKDIKINLWNHGYVKTIESKIGCKYSEINESEDNRIKAVTSIAAISRGKDKSNNPKKRFEHLLKEAAPNISFVDLENGNYDNIEHIAGRPVEYCPVVLNIFRDDLTGEVEIRDFSDKSIITILEEKFENKIIKFSYLENKTLYTNLRALLNAGLTIDEIPFNPKNELKNMFFIAEVKAPYFVFAQMRTHGLLSQIAISERVVDSEDIWMPEDIFDRIKENENVIWYIMPRLSALYDKEIMTHQLDLAIVKREIDRLLYIFKSLPIEIVQTILKDLGYKKEVYQRWYNHMLYKTWIIGGYLNNPYQWGHFLLEREAYNNLLKSWVQPQTKEVAKALRKLILDYLKKEEK